MGYRQRLMTSETDCDHSPCLKKTTSPYVSHDALLSITNRGQLELLLAMTERGAPLRTMVRGFSMHPFIRDKDVLTIVPLNDRQLSPGDVVAFKMPGSGRLAIHRIIAQTDKGCLIRGDNCPEPDGIVFPENVIGRVCRVERDGSDVHLGIGLSGKFIAFLNRRRVLMRLKQFRMLLRRSAGCLLRSLQSLAIYRRLGRRFTPSAVISVADEADMEAVHDRSNSVVPYRNSEQRPHVVNLAAKSKGRLIGFVQLVYHPATHAPWVGYWLFSLQVSPLCRGTGIGRQLTRRIIDEATARGAEELFLIVHEHNRRAIRLYRSCGFERHIIPDLELLLADEKKRTGRQRIVMRKTIRQEP